MSYRLDVWRTVSLQVALLYGHFIPGPAFADSRGRGRAIDLLMGRSVISF